MKGRNGPTAFLPLIPKLGGQINDSKPIIGQYLTREQANFVYKTETDEMINTETLQQEIEHERQLNKIDYVSGDTKSLQRNDSKQCRKDKTIVSTNGTVANFEQHIKLHTVL